MCVCVRARARAHLRACVHMNARCYILFLYLSGFSAQCFTDHYFFFKQCLYASSRNFVVVVVRLCKEIQGRDAHH